jgi:predicted phosphodiesterase
MKILAISDLHGYFPAIPPCDILLLGGDYCPYHNIEDQLRWFNGPFAEYLKSIPACHKIAVAGNHDFALQRGYRERLGPLAWTLLQDDTARIKIDGRQLRIHGTPWTPTFGAWAFMGDEHDLETIYADIPHGLDILISHGPPQGVVDRNFTGMHCGSSALRSRLMVAQPQVVVCGHIHEAHGMGKLGKTVIYNVSHVNLGYRPSHGPVEIEL